jgi:hypothetical protein
VFALNRHSDSEIEIEIDTSAKRMEYVRAWFYETVFAAVRLSVYASIENGIPGDDTVQAINALKVRTTTCVQRQQRCRIEDNVPTSMSFPCTVAVQVTERQV